MTTQQRIDEIQRRLDNESSGASTASHTPNSKFGKSYQERDLPSGLFRSQYRDMDDMPVGERLSTHAYSIQPNTHRQTVIWLHDMGDSKRNVIPLFESMDTRDTRIVVPFAPRIPVTGE
jgi:actin-related protein